VAGAGAILDVTVTSALDVRWNKAVEGLPTLLRRGGNGSSHRRRDDRDLGVG
jgi:hypothetical protein